MVKYSFSDSILESKNGWFAGSPIQHFWAHSGRIWARHSRDKGATRQVDQTDQETNKKYARRHLWISIPLIVTNLAFSGTSTQSRSCTLDFDRKNVPLKIYRPFWQPHVPTLAITQILGKHPSLQIKLAIQETVSGNQERAKTKINGTLSPSHIPSYFPSC